MAATRRNWPWLLLVPGALVLARFWAAPASPSTAVAPAVSTTPKVPVRAAQSVVTRREPASTPGRVVSSSGAGLPALVCASREPSLSPVSERCIETDPTGTFSLQLEPGAPHTISVSAPRHLSASRRVAAGAAPARLDFTLPEGGAHVAGVTLDAKGGPVAGALLLAVAARGEALTHAVSDQDGHFALALPAGDASLVAHRDGYASARTELLAPASDVRVILTPASAIVGRVVELGTDAGVARAVVSARPRNGTLERPESVATSDDGSFRLQGVTAGAYDLTAIAPGRRSSPRFVRVDVASESEPVTLEVSNALAVNASVLVGEAPCERGQVHLLGSVALAAAIDRGQALFPAVPEGRYAARVQCAAGIAREFELSAPAAGDVRPVWKLEAGHELVGRVVSASGAGVPGLDLQWRATEANPSTPREFASACRTDAGGAFRCGAFAGGRYRCAIEGGAHDDCSDVVVPRETPLQIALRPLGTIRATLSESLTAVSVVATGSDGAEHFARYSGGDTFSIVGLPLGEYRVGLAGQPDLARARLDHDGQLVEVRLAAPAVVLEGRVVDERGEPIVEAWVRASAIAAVGPGSEAPPALTGDGGEFSIPALAKGRYALSVTSSAGEARVDEAETGRPVLITLKAFGSMGGTVRSQDGKPVSAFLLRYEDGETQHEERISSPTGSWLVPWLQSGPWTVQVASEAGSARAVVHVPGADRAEIPLVLGERLPGG